MQYMPGSILARPLDGFWGLFYSHMGIYVGDGEVIHFSGEKKTRDDATICKETLPAFRKGRRVRVHATPSDERHGSAVCAEAERLYQMGHNGFNNQYHFVFKNCEDFCVQCFEVRY